jgi:hypothetical protein
MPHILNNILREIATRIRGNKCEKLVKRIGNEITLSGASLVSGGFKMNLGTFSNKVKEIVKVPDVAVALDDSQYLLCTAISDMTNDNQLKDKCIAIRLQLIMAFNQLRALLYSIQQESSDDTTYDDAMTLPATVWIEIEVRMVRIVRIMCLKVSGNILD